MLDRSTYWVANVTRFQWVQASSCQKGSISLAEKFLLGGAIRSVACWVGFTQKTPFYDAPQQYRLCSCTRAKATPVSAGGCEFLSADGVGIKHCVEFPPDVPQVSGVRHWGCMKSLPISLVMMRLLPAPWMRVEWHQDWACCQRALPAFNKSPGSPGARGESGTHHSHLAALLPGSPVLVAVERDQSAHVCTFDSDNKASSCPMTARVTGCARSSLYFFNKGQATKFGVFPSALCLCGQILRQRSGEHDGERSPFVDGGITTDGEKGSRPNPNAPSARRNEANF